MTLLSSPQNVLNEKDFSFFANFNQNLKYRHFFLKKVW